MLFATIQYGDHSQDGKPYWDWKILEGESTDDPRASTLARRKDCLHFLQSNFCTDVYLVTSTDIMRPSARRRWREAGCQDTMRSPDDEQKLMVGLSLLIPGLDLENIVVLPPL